MQYYLSAEQVRRGKSVLSAYEQGRLNPGFTLPRPSPLPAIETYVAYSGDSSIPAISGITPGSADNIAIYTLDTTSGELTNTSPAYTQTIYNLGPEIDSDTYFLVNRDPYSGQYFAFYCCGQASPAYLCFNATVPNGVDSCLAKPKLFCFVSKSPSHTNACLEVQSSGSSGSLKGGKIAKTSGLQNISASAGPIQLTGMSTVDYDSSSYTTTSNELTIQDTGYFDIYLYVEFSTSTSSEPAQAPITAQIKKSSTVLTENITMIDSQGSGDSFDYAVLAYDAFVSLTGGTDVLKAYLINDASNAMTVTAVKFWCRKTDECG